MMQSALALIHLSPAGVTVGLLAAIGYAVGKAIAVLTRT